MLNENKKTRPKLKHLRLEILPVRGVSYVLINQLAEMLINNIDHTNPTFCWKYCQLHDHLSKIGTTPFEYLQTCKITKSVISDFVIVELLKSFREMQY